VEQLVKLDPGPLKSPPRAIIAARQCLDDYPVS
jgi:hypothetical protein